MSKESIIDVQAEVVKAAEKIESCTHQTIELHVHQVYCNVLNSLNCRYFALSYM